MNITWYKQKPNGYWLLETMGSHLWLRWFGIHPSGWDAPPVSWIQRSLEPDLWNV